MKQRRSRGFLRSEGGVAMVEFAILIILLLLILLGTIQFGLMWFTKYVITCGSREGARYATIYASTANAAGIQTRVPPSNLNNPSVQQVVQNYCSNLLKNTPITFTPSGPGWTTGNSGTDVTIQVSCQNPYNLLGGLMPSLSNITFRAQTTMKCD